MSRVVLVAYALFTFFVILTNVQAHAQDSSGGATGNAANALNSGGAAFTADDIKALTTDAEKPATKGELLKVADVAGQSTIAINLVWMMVSGFMVMFMQAGFAMVEAGFCRAKHAAHVFMTNFAIYPIGMLGFWIAGFAIMFGSLNGPDRIGGPLALGGLGSLAGAPVYLFPGFSIAGTSGFFLTGQYDIIVYAFFLFQMVFMDTTATIPTGAMAERWRFTAFIVYGFFISMVIYPVYGHLVWGAGGLASLGKLYNMGHGVVDFAGSSVVHAVGGWVALAGSIVLGPRIGKYVNGKSVTLAGHHIPMALVGTFILAFGWFGFNAGSMLGAAGAGNLRIGVVATNTMLASAGGAFVAMMYMKLTTGKFDPGNTANGMLGGLVAITAPCAFVDSLSSVIIGAIAALLVIWSIGFWDKRGIDDPVGAISVHGIGGIFGLLSVGIFSDGTYGAGWNGVGATEYLGKAGLGVTGILHGDSSQLVAQAIGAVVCILWSFGTGFIFFKLQSLIMPLRPSAEDEIAGLDIPEMGVLAYPSFPLAPEEASTADVR
ncbi:MAG: ammonium transporter [Fimbriimonas sp.]